MCHRDQIRFLLSPKGLEGNWKRVKSVKHFDLRNESSVNETESHYQTLMNYLFKSKNIIVIIQVESIW